MIYDCFTLFNELDLLEIRLRIMNDKVDYFVIAEANKTHTGKDKPLYFEQNRERYNEFLNKIIYIPVTDMPNVEIDLNRWSGSGKSKENNPAWILERHQRDCLKRGLINIKDDDIIIISDLDEIIDPKILDTNIQGVYKAELKWCCFFANRVKGTCNWGAVIGRGKHFSNPNAWRDSGLPVIKNAGWHLSWLGGVDSIIEKVEAFAEMQENKPENKDRERIARCLNNDEDMFRQGVIRTYNEYPPIFNEPKFQKYLKR
jgi:beta-1,4-mannosyl-glycoprotein beta-1,4-N-acetylglucosaminyltransferase